MLTGVGDGVLGRPVSINRPVSLLDDLLSRPYRPTLPHEFRPYQFVESHIPKIRKSTDFLRLLQNPPRPVAERLLAKLLRRFGFQALKLALKVAIKNTPVGRALDLLSLLDILVERGTQTSDERVRSALADGKLLWQGDQTDRAEGSFTGVLIGVKPPRLAAWNQPGPAPEGYTTTWGPLPSKYPWCYWLRDINPATKEILVKEDMSNAGTEPGPLPFPLSTVVPFGRPGFPVLRSSARRARSARKPVEVVVSVTKGAGPPRINFRVRYAPFPRRKRGDDIKLERHRLHRAGLRVANFASEVVDALECLAGASGAGRGASLTDALFYGAENGFDLGKVAFCLAQNEVMDRVVAYPSQRLQRLLREEFKRNPHIRGFYDIRPRFAFGLGY